MMYMRKKADARHAVAANDPWEPCLSKESIARSIVDKLVGGRQNVEGFFKIVVVKP